MFDLRLRPLLFKPHANAGPSLSYPHQAGSVSMRSVDSASVWAPDVGPAVFPRLALTVALHSRLSNKTSRLHRCDLGRAVGCSACPPPAWGLTHGMRPGVSLWAGVAGFLRGQWLPALFCCSLFVSFRLLGGGNVNLLNKTSTCSRPVRPMVIRVPTSYPIAAGDCENVSL